MRNASAVLVLALLVPRPALPCSPAPTSSTALVSFPEDDAVPFPHDASPLVVLGHGITESFEEGPLIEPRIFDALGEAVDADLTVEVRFATREMTADWIRIHPWEPLVVGERYSVRLMAPEGRDETQERLDSMFGVREFVAGDSRVDLEPEPIDFTIRVLHYPGGLSLPSPCGPSTPYGDSQRVRVGPVERASADQAFDQWRFFLAGEDFDPAPADHRAWVEAALTREEFVDGTRDLTGWTQEVAAGEEVCVVMVTEDGYGRISDVSEPACAEPIPACAADCNAAGGDAAGVAVLLGLVPLAGRRLRRRVRSDC